MEKFLKSLQTSDMLLMFYKTSKAISHSTAALTLMSVESVIFTQTPTSSERLDYESRNHFRSVNPDASAKVPQRRSRQPYRPPSSSSPRSRPPFQSPEFCHRSGPLCARNQQVVQPSSRTASSMTSVTDFHSIGVSMFGIGSSSASSK